MAKIPADPQAPEFQIRPGVDPVGTDRWKGVNTESDPASLAPNELQRGDDIRLSGRIILTRPPLIERLNLSSPPGGSSSPGGKILAMKEGPVDNPRVRLWFAEVGCYGVALGTGGEILQVDPTQDPIVQSYSSFYCTNDTQPVLASYGESLIAANSSVVHTVAQIPAPPGMATGSVIPSPPVISAMDFPGYTVSCMQEFDGKLFIGLTNVSTPASSKIMSWDGITVKDDTVGGYGAINPPVAMGVWQGTKLVVGFATGPAGVPGVITRVAGSSPGTYSTVTDANMTCSSYGNAMEEVRQYLYIAGGGRYIHRFDGVGAGSLTTRVCDVGATGIVTALTTYHGLLHYGWYTTAAGASFIGRHDPDSSANEWYNSQKDITTDLATFKYLTSMKGYRQSIYCGGRLISICSTSPDNIRGTATLLYSVTGTATFQLAQIVRFPAIV